MMWTTFSFSSLGHMLTIASVMSLAWAGGVFAHSHEISLSADTIAHDHEGTDASHHHDHQNTFYEHSDGRDADKGDGSIHCGGLILALTFMPEPHNCPSLSQHEQIAQSDRIAVSSAPEPPPPRTL